MTRLTSLARSIIQLARPASGQRLPEAPVRGFAHNVAVLSGGTAIAQSLTVIIAPLLTRLYRPGDLGEFALFVSFLNVAILGVALRYELAVVAATDNRKAAQLAFAASVFLLPGSGVCAGVLYLLIHFSVLGFGALPLYTSLVSLPAVIFAGGFSILRYWCLREERFASVSQATIAQHATRALSQLSLGAIGERFGGLLSGELLGRSAGLTRMFRVAWPIVRAEVCPIRLNELRHALWENRQFPLYSLPSSLLDSMASNLCIPLVVLCYGTEGAGYFALVQRVLAVPLMLISLSVADAFHARLAHYARKAPDRVLSLFRSTSLGLLLAGTVPSLALILFARPLFRFCFGDRWAMSGVLAAAVTPWFFAQFAVGPLSRLVFVLHGQRTKLIYDVFALVSMVGVFVFSASRRLTLTEAVLMLAATSTAAYVVYYLVLLRTVLTWTRNRLPRVEPSTCAASIASQ